MPVDKLANLPRGSDVFLDANILIYAPSGKSGECKALLERCSREELSGITSFLVVSEVTHRLMCEEAVAAGFVEQKNASKQLAERPEIVKALTGYWADIERLLSLNLVFFSIDEQIIRGAQAVRRAAGLLNNDSILISCMKYLGIPYLASNDSDFQAIPSIFLYKPTDI